MAGDYTAEKEKLLCDKKRNFSLYSPYPAKSIYKAACVMSKLYFIILVL